MLLALDFEKECNLQRSHISSTKLNICAILSLMSKHKEAIKFCASAITDILDSLKIIKVKLMTNPKKQGKVMKEIGVTE